MSGVYFLGGETRMAIWRFAMPFCTAGVGVRHLGKLMSGLMIDTECPVRA
jgi:hypothetical protein